MKSLSYFGDKTVPNTSSEKDNKQVPSIRLGRHWICLYSHGVPSLSMGHNNLVDLLRFHRVTYGMLESISHGQSNIVNYMTIWVVDVQY